MGASGLRATPWSAGDWVGLAALRAGHGGFGMAGLAWRDFTKRHLIFEELLLSKVATCYGIVISRTFWGGVRVVVLKCFGIRVGFGIDFDII